jgi:hypothetical protein
LNSPNDVVVASDRSIWFTQLPGSDHVDRQHHVKAFDVVGGRRLAASACSRSPPGFPDGLKGRQRGPRVRILLVRRPGARQHQKELIKLHEWCAVGLTNTVTVLPND